MKVIRFRTDMAPDAIKTLAFQIKNNFIEAGKDGNNLSLMVVIGGVCDDKPSLTVLLSDNLVKDGYNAVTLTREAAKFINGGGGGQPHFATAGGKNVDGLNQAMEHVKL